MNDFSEINNLMNTAVIDKDGLPKVVYHGTFSDIKSFDERKAGIGFLGMGFYFTDSRQDASDNYANAPKYASLGIDTTKFGNAGVVMPCLLDIKKPLVVGGPGTTRFGLADGSLQSFLTQYKLAGKEYPDVPAYGVRYMADERFPKEARMSKRQSLSAEDLVDLVNRQIGLNAGTDIFNGDTRQKMQMLQSTFIAMGFDGVVYNDVQKRFGAKMEGITKATRHYVAFRSEQVLPAIGSPFYIPQLRDQLAANLRNEIDEQESIRPRPRA